MSPTKSHEPRSRQLNIALTERELVELTRRAEALGMRPVHLGRALVVAQAHGAPIDTGSRAPEPDNFTRLLYNQLSRLGNNLNQLVRHLHKTGEALPADLEPLLADIRRALERRTR